MAVAEKLKEWWAKLTKGAGSAGNKTKDVAGAAVGKSKDVAGTVVDKTKEVAGKTDAKTEDKVDAPPEAVIPPTDAVDGSQ